MQAIPLRYDSPQFFNISKRFPIACPNMMAPESVVKNLVEVGAPKAVPYTQLHDFDQNGSQNLIVCDWIPEGLCGHCPPFDLE